jgi:hypothetical protein
LRGGWELRQNREHHQQQKDFHALSVKDLPKLTRALRCSFARSRFQCTSSGLMI